MSNPHREGESPVDFSALYDAHPEYVARRENGSLEQAQIDIEVRLFKVPRLMELVPHSMQLQEVLEIGCATGELIDAVPLPAGGKKMGIDISEANIATARSRFSQIEFSCGDFRTLKDRRFDAVIMSDVLEHVPDDCVFLAAAATLGDVVLVNLPLEDNWLNRGRRYGPDDVSGHLRKYSLEEGLALFDRASVDVLAHSCVWFHESVAARERRSLRRQRLGSEYSGRGPVRAAKRVIDSVAIALPHFGRRLYSSNLFALGRKRTVE